MILNDSTVSSEIDSNQISKLHEGIPEIKDETITGFITQNEEKRRLKSIRGIDFYVFQSEYEGTDRDTVRVFLSQIGYDDIMTQAIVVMGEIFGPEAGGGILFFLIREDGEWKVSDRFGLWVN